MEDWAGRSEGKSVYPMQVTPPWRTTCGRAGRVDHAADHWFSLFLCRVPSPGKGSHYLGVSLAGSALLGAQGIAFRKRAPIRGSTSCTACLGALGTRVRAHVWLLSSARQLARPPAVPCPAPWFRCCHPARPPGPLRKGAGASGAPVTTDVRIMLQAGSAFSPSSAPLQWPYQFS